MAACSYCVFYFMFLIYKHFLPFVLFKYVPLSSKFCCSKTLKSNNNNNNNNNTDTQIVANADSVNNLMRQWNTWYQHAQYWHKNST